MKGWEIKPLGSIVLFAVVTLLIYTGYKFVRRHRTQEGESPTDENLFAA